MKIKSFFAGLLFTIASVSAQPAKADDFRGFVRAMVFFGVTDAATVNHNVDVYLLILNDIKSEILKHEIDPLFRGFYFRKRFEDLKGRIDSQFGSLAPVFRPLIAPRLSAILFEAKLALDEGKEKRMLELVEYASAELKAVKIK